MTAEPGRVAAYADLVAAVLDLRGSGPTQAFDAALADALATGAISDDLARQLRWLQRVGERAIVEHAEAVLPPALVALQAIASHAGAAIDHQATPTTDRLADDLAQLTDLAEPVEPEPAPVVALEGRRVLVAGLRPLPDPAHRGTLP